MPKDNSEKETASTEPDPNLYFGTGEFTLPNGDTYTGDYCAHRYGLIWREGSGIYTTKDGQTYEGEWRDDKLVEEQEVVIKFPSGEEYHGCTLQDKYAGAGIYSMENKMDISCQFVDNKPKGNVMLIDINGRIWEGQAGENDALLVPENLFYFNISEDTGIGKLKPKYQAKEEVKLSEGSAVSEEEAVVLSYRELEKIIFAKTTKTLNDIDFTQSKWFQRYLRYKTMKGKITDKLKTEEGSRESLTEEEKKWQKKYQRHKLEHREKTKQKKNEKARRSLVDTSLLDVFYSKEFKRSCPPMKVFHPSCDWVDKSQPSTEVTEEPTTEEVEKAIKTTELEEGKVKDPKKKK